jgi:vitamin B12 transporter
MEAPVARVTRVLLSVLSLLLIPTAAAAAAPLTGSVVDASGAALARAFVRVIDAAGRERAATITDDRGRFDVDLTACDDCRIEAALGGFRTGRTAAITAAQRADAQFYPRVTLQVAPISDAVVVTPTRDAAPTSQIGASVSVFTAEDIARRGFPSVADLLRETPGTSVIRSGGLGNVTSLFMRGGESNYTKVLLDGVPLNEPGGTFNFGNLSTGNLARVEVVRGAQSALFGSDAMSGVIQLFTARGSAGARPTVTGAFEAGGYGTTRGQATVSGTQRGWDYSVGVVQFGTDNRAANNRFDNTTVSWNGGGSLTSRLALRLTGRLEQGTTGVPGATAFGRPDLDASFDRSDIVSGVSLEHRASDRIKQRVSYAFSRSRQESVNLIADPSYVPTYGTAKAPFAFSDFTYDSQNLLRRHVVTYQADARFTGRLNQFVSLVADWDGERATLNDRKAATSLPASRNNVGVSLQHQLLGRRGSLTSSVRLEHNDSFGNEWVPRVSVAFIARESAGLVGNTTFKANAGRGVKEPTVLQSFSPNPGFLGNADLLPERARTWDAGFEQRLAADHVRIEATYFDNRYQDQITTKTTSANPFRSQYLNKFGFTTARGVETSIEIAPIASVRLSGGYSFLDADVLDRATADSTPATIATALIRRPRHSAFMRAGWTWRAASADVDGVFVGTRLDNDFSSLSPAITSSGDYWLWNLAGRYRFTTHIDGYARVQNIANRDYMEPLGFPAWRRTVHAGLSIRF